MYGIDNLIIDVKLKLFTEDAENVIHAFIRLTDAIVYTDQLRFTVVNNGHINMERVNELRRRKVAQDVKEDDLRLLVYGEKRWRMSN